MMRWIFCFFFFSLTLNAFADEDPWYKTAPSCVIDRGNPARTGEYKVAPLENLQGAVWTVDNLIRDGSPMVCGDGLWFIQPFYAFKSFTIASIKNKRLDENYFWSISSGKQFSEQSTFYKGILYTNNDLYYWMNKIGVQGFDGKTGQPAYMLVSGNSASSHTPLLFDDVIYVPEKNAVEAYDLKTKKRLWSIPVNIKFNKYVSSSGPLSTDGKNVYVQDKTESIYAINMMSGKIQWIQKHNVQYGYPNYLIPYEDKLFAVADKKIYALSLQTGKIIWKKDINDAIGMLSLSDGLLFVPLKKENKNFLFAFNVNTGETTWSKPYTTWQTFIAGKVIYFIDEDAYQEKYKVYALNKYTGDVLWSYILEKHFDDDGKGHNRPLIVPVEKQLLVSGLNGELFLVY